jgi:hypothetical protein
VGASGWAGASGRALSTGVTGSGAIGGADTSVVGAASAGAAGVAFFAAAFLAGAFLAGASAAGAAAGMASRSLRTTGGSTVDDADRTNSPISWSLVMTTLLSTPSSLASS